MDDPYVFSVSWDGTVKFARFVGRNWPWNDSAIDHGQGVNPNGLPFDSATLAKHDNDRPYVLPSRVRTPRRERTSSAFSPLESGRGTRVQTVRR